MHWLFDLEDVDEVWRTVAEMAEARGDFIARPENLDLINANLKEQGGILLSLKEKIRTEWVWSFRLIKGFVSQRLETNLLFINVSYSGWLGRLLLRSLFWAGSWSSLVRAEATSIRIGSVFPSKMSSPWNTRLLKGSATWPLLWKPILEGSATSSQGAEGPRTVVPGAGEILFSTARVVYLIFCCLAQGSSLTGGEGCLRRTMQRWRVWSATLATSRAILLGVALTRGGRGLGGTTNPEPSLRKSGPVY